MKKKKIKWGNIVKALIFLFSIIIIFHDVYMVTFGGYCFTWFGLITFIICCGIASQIFLDFREKKEMTQATGNSLRHNKT